MKQPKYITEFLSWVLFWVGVLFFSSSMAVNVAISNSNDILMLTKLATAYDVLIMVFYVAIFSSTFLRFIVKTKERTFASTLEEGTEVEGEVLEILNLKWLRNKQPFPIKIVYSYSLFGEQHLAKSHILWDITDIDEGDIIYVYVGKTGASAVDL